MRGWGKGKKSAKQHAKIYKELREGEREKERELLLVFVICLIDHQYPEITKNLKQKTNMKKKKKNQTFRQNYKGRER